LRREAVENENMRIELQKRERALE